LVARMNLNLGERSEFWAEHRRLYRVSPQYRVKWHAQHPKGSKPIPPRATNELPRVTLAKFILAHDCEQSAANLGYYLGQPRQCLLSARILDSGHRRRHFARHRRYFLPQRTGGKDARACTPGLGDDTEQPCRRTHQPSRTSGTPPSKGALRASSGGLPASPPSLYSRAFHSTMDNYPDWPLQCTESINPNFWSCAQKVMAIAFAPLGGAWCCCRLRMRLKGGYAHEHGAPTYLPELR
jgi:hypothetical protein